MEAMYIMQRDLRNQDKTNSSRSILTRPPVSTAMFTVFILYQKFGKHMLKWSHLLYSPLFEQSGNRVNVYKC